MKRVSIPTFVFMGMVVISLFTGSCGFFKKSPDKISGSFVQPWFVEPWTATDWKKEITDLKNAGVDDHIIWQWTADSLNKTTWYPTKILGFKKTSGMADEDPVMTSLDQAKKANMKMWLGLNWTDDWWNKYANDEAWLKNEFEISRQVADELWSRYGSLYSDTIAGFYLTMEVDNDNFKTIELQDRMEAVYKNICDHIHANMNKPVMIAPFCSDAATMKQSEWQSMWENILTTASIDVINMQDGCGASDDGKTTHTTVQTVGSWFAATKRSIEKAHPAAQLWSDLETFDMDAQWNCFSANSFNRITKQIDAERAYVTKFSSFAVMHYQTMIGEDKKVNEKSAAQYEMLKKMQGKR